MIAVNYDLKPRMMMKFGYIRETMTVFCGKVCIPFGCVCGSLCKAAPCSLVQTIQTNPKIVVGNGDRVITKL